MSGKGHVAQRRRNCDDVIDTGYCILPSSINQCKNLPSFTSFSLLHSSLLFLPFLHLFTLFYSHLFFKIPIQVNCEDIQEPQVTDSNRKRKLHAAQDIDDGKDVISSLPNCVLSHILSFLPTKDAVGSCILSRRWQDLWTGLPNIDFDDRQVYCRSMNLSEEPISFFELAPFHNFVERVLIHRDVTYMTRFQLSCRVWCETRVSSWISSAIRRNVKELELFLKLHNPFHLPPRVFNCSSLRTLKICMECTLKLPNNVFLPNVRTLYLGAVGFSDEESVNKLFSGCPALEELKLIDCSWGKLESITISIPTLKRLRIDELFYMLSVNKRNDCIIKLELPNLVSFEFLGGLFNVIVLENQMPQLTHATVFILERPWCNFNTTLPPDVFNLFTRLKHATVLRVSSSTIKTLFVAEGFLGQLPLFQMLTRLELNVCIEDVSPEVLLKFLVGFPCLEILVFHEGAVSDQLHFHHDVCSTISQPSCNLPKLKMINLCFLHGGSVGEMYVLKNVVDIAPALQKVSIFCCSKMGLSKKDEIARKLQMLLDVCKGNFTVLFS